MALKSSTITISSPMINHNKYNPIINLLSPIINHYNFPCDSPLWLGHLPGINHPGVAAGAAMDVGARNPHQGAGHSTCHGQTGEIGLGRSTTTTAVKPSSLEHTAVNHILTTQLTAHSWATNTQLSKNQRLLWMHQFFAQLWIRIYMLNSYFSRK